MSNLESIKEMRNLLLSSKADLEQQYTKLGELLSQKERLEDEITDVRSAIHSNRLYIQQYGV